MTCYTVIESPLGPLTLTSDGASLTRRPAHGRGARCFRRAPRPDYFVRRFSSKNETTRCS